MKKLLLLFFITLTISQQAEIVNIQVAQRTDGSKLVDIYYSLNSEIENKFYEIDLEVSFDNGQNFTTIYQLSGDVGKDILSGPDKHIIWNAGIESPGTFSESVVFKVNGQEMNYYEEFGFITIPRGEFLHGGNNEPVNLDYDYEIMSKVVTTGQFARFLNMQHQLGNEETYLYLNENYCVWSDPGNGADDMPCDTWDSNTNCIETYSGSFSFNYFDCSVDFGGIIVSDYNQYLSIPDIVWNGFNYIVLSHPDLPVRGVTTLGVYAFANYFGYTIPTLYEWEKASRGIDGATSPIGVAPVDPNQCFYNLDLMESNGYMQWMSYAHEMFIQNYYGLPYFSNECNDISPYGVIGTFSYYPEITSDICFDLGTHKVVGPAIQSQGDYNYSVLDSIKNCNFDGGGHQDPGEHNWDGYSGEYWSHFTGTLEEPGILNVTFRLVKK